MNTAVKKIGFVAGLVGFVLLLVFYKHPEYPQAGAMAGVTCLMAVWWITEAIPIPATALVPLALFGVLKIMTGKETAPFYANYLIFLFTGGFIIALAMERWNLHRRIALGIIGLIGSKPRQLVLGFMLATAFLSMWISNTATTMMFLPIAMSVIGVIRQKIKDDHAGLEDVKLKERLRFLDNFSVTLMLSIAYAASIGGISTLVGTPTNVSLLRIYEIHFPQAAEISFASWFAMALPLSMVFLLIAWFVMTVVLFPTRGGRFFEGDEVIRRERAKLGPMSAAELRVLIVFAATAVLWFLRRDIRLGPGEGGFVIPGWSGLLGIAEYVDDGTVAIFMALLLFIIPSGKKKGQVLMNWETAVKLPWGILLLFGGGFALAGGIKETGLSTLIGEQLKFLAPYPSYVLVGGISTLMTFMTEVTTNTATTNMILPIIAGISESIEVPPLLLMIPATLSASCAFMLPVATPPNAIVFASGYVPIRKMVLAGIVLNLIGIVLVTLTVLFIAKGIFSL